MDPLKQLRLVKHAMNGFLTTSEPPRIPEFSTIDRRHRSFNGQEHKFKLSPEELSDAGFFYPGRGRAVQCFYCAGSIEGLSRHDVAWEEHAFWFSKCVLVRTLKGLDYIKRVNQKKENDLNVKLECATPTANPNTSCKVCMDKVAEILFLPCRHLATCRECKLQLLICPMCRKRCDSFIHVFHC
jgi:baculoviral IAP repeat-containing protein 7/8